MDELDHGDMTSHKPPGEVMLHHQEANCTQAHTRLECPIWARQSIDDNGCNGHMLMDWTI